MMLDDEDDKSPKNQRGLTPFHTACESGHIKTAEMLIMNSSNLKIDLNTKDNDGRTAFHLACSEGCLEIAELLIRYSHALKIDLNATDICGGNTAFHFACMKGQLKIIEMFIRNAADPNQGTIMTPNIDLNAKSKSGST